MSSKSRKHTPDPERPVPAARPAASPVEVQAAEPSAKDFQDAEDLLKVPRGRSRATYAFLIFLLIFLTAVFVVLDYLPQGGGAGEDRVEMSWQRPGVGKVEYRTRDWWRERRIYGLSTEFMRGRGASLEGRELASFLVLDTLALDAGIRVTDDELRSQLGRIASSVGGVAAYESLVRSMRGIGPREFEETVRRMLRVERLRNLMGLFSTQPGVDSIESIWNERRKETRWQYTIVDVAAYRDAALAEQPDDAALEAWFAARPETERRKYEGAAAVRAELVGLLVPQSGDMPAAEALLAAYPDGEDVDGAARGRKFYDDYAYVRFPAPEGAGDAIYQAYEEVAESAALQGRLLAALRAWRVDLEAREAAGETVDLAAEAERLGLHRDAPETALTQLEWRERAGLAGTYAAGQIARLEAGRLANGVIVERGGFAVVRALEQVPPSVPPFAQIRDQVLNDWADARAKELATQELADLRNRFAPEVAEGEALPEPAPAPKADGERFAELVAAAGLEVGVREWLDSGAPVDQDPGSALAAHTILRTRAAFQRLGEGEISTPLESADGKHVLLARLDGERPVPLDRMKPADFASILQDARQRAEFDWLLGGNPFATDTVLARYSVRITSELEQAEDSADGAPTPAPAEGS